MLYDILRQYVTLYIYRLFVTFKHASTKLEFSSNQAIAMSGIICRFIAQG